MESSSTHPGSPQLRRGSRGEENIIITAARRGAAEKKNENETKRRVAGALRVVDAALELEQALELYKLDVGRFPNNGEGLEALVRSPSRARGWNGPYLRKDEIPLDPWGNEYYCEASNPVYNVDFDIISFGSDGQPGGDGDAEDIISGQD